MKKAFIFLFVASLGVLLYIQFQPSKDTTWQAKEGSIFIYEVSGKTEEVAKGMYDRLDHLEILGAPRVFTYGKNRIVVQIPPLKDLKNKVKQYLLTASLQLRLVASPSVGFGLDERQEREAYQEAKAKGNLDSYRSRLYEKGYAWFPSKKGNESLLWVKDGYNITQESLADVSYDNKNQSINLLMKPQPAKDFAVLTKNYEKEHLAIVFDNVIFASPIIQSQIPNGSIALRGFSSQEATQLKYMSDTISLAKEPRFVKEIDLDALQGTQQQYGFFTYISLKKGTEIPKSISFEVRKIKNQNDENDKYIVIGNIKNADFHKKYNELNSTFDKVQESAKKLESLEKQGIRLLEKKFSLRRLVTKSKRNNDVERVNILRSEIHNCKGELKQKELEITTAEKTLAKINQIYTDLLETITKTYKKDFEKNIRSVFSKVIEKDSFSTIDFVQEFK